VTTPPPRVHHLALRVGDPDRAAAFYRGLGLVETRRIEEGGVLRAVWLRASGTVLMLERTLRGGGPAEGSGHVLAFAVEDLAEAEALCHRSAIAIEDRTASTLYVRDPDGHRVGLSVFRFDDTP
jgi:catechol 2,3-dioxygenase-like lactoylglutathione lyase family enzyme